MAYADAKGTWMCVKMCVHLHDEFPLFVPLSLTPETQHAPICELSRWILCGHHLVYRTLEVLRKHCQMIMKKNAFSHSDLARLVSSMVGEEKKQRLELPSNACCEQEPFSGSLTTQTMLRRVGFYGRCYFSGFYKNVFYRWIKAYKMRKKVRGGAGVEYFSSIQIKIRKTNERLMSFT